jgi:hypothetical protein
VLHNKHNFTGRIISSRERIEERHSRDVCTMTKTAEKTLMHEFLGITNVHFIHWENGLANTRFTGIGSGCSFLGFGWVRGSRIISTFRIDALQELCVVLVRGNEVVCQKVLSVYNTTGSRAATPDEVVPAADVG